MILLAAVSANLYGKTPDRTVLYTMNRNEIMDYCEYFIQYQTDGYRFAMMTTDTVTSKKTLVFNGKRVPIPDDSWDICRLGYINVNEPDGYMIVNKGKDGYYVDNGGNLEGPYEYVLWENPVYDGYDFAAPRMSRTYHYVLADRVYDNVGGNRRKSQGIYYMGDFRNDGNVYLSVDGKLDSYPSYGEVYIAGDNYFYHMIDDVLYMNGIRIEDNVAYLAVNGRGDYAYCTYEDSTNFIHKNYRIYKNGEPLVSETYDAIDEVYLTEGGKVAYVSNGTEVHLPGLTLVNDGIERVCDLRYHDDGSYAFIYIKDGKWYVRMKGMPDKGPYDYASVTSHESGKFIFYYYVGSSCFIVDNADNTYGPYDNIYDYGFSESGGLMFRYYEDGKEYVYDNGMKRRLFNDPYIIDLEEEGHSFYSHYAYDYVVIDGQRIGSSPAMNCYYDRDKRAFVWYSVEGPDFVVYEYGLD